jgi:signal transduction histidine kinase
MAVGLRTPEDIVRQTSLSNFQGQQVVFGISILTILIGVLVGGFVMRRETQRRFLVEEALSQSEKEQAIVTERNRLAAELHDSVTQGLYGIMLHADAAKGLLAKGKKDKATEYLEEIKATGKEGLAEMRLLIFELRPPVLEAEGLAAALEMRLYAVEKRAGLKAEIKSEIEGRLPLEIEDGLYRISQEVLNNALKHAEAQHIWVQISQDRDMVRLEIKDDGRGFNLDTARKSGGMGLSGIEERAAKIDGKLVIESQPEQGTRTVIEVKI